MRRALALVVMGALAATILAVPATATTTRIAVSCTETRLTDWTGGREWVDGDLVYHSRDWSATYRDAGSPWCAGFNHTTVMVNLDLLTGEGVVRGSGHMDLDAFDGGWDAVLVAHFTPDGEYIWEGQVIGHGFGELAGYQYRATIVEPSHETAIMTGFVFLPGS